MTRYKSVALGSLLGIVLSLAPLTSAFAQHRHHGGHVFWPIAGLAAAVVGTAAAIVTAPIAIVAAALLLRLQALIAVLAVAMPARIAASLRLILQKLGHFRVEFLVALERTAVTLVRAYRQQAIPVIRTQMKSNPCIPRSGPV